MKTEAGFSLMELLVALSLAAIISVLLMGGLGFASKAWTKTNAIADSGSEIYGTQSVLRRALSGITLAAHKNKFAGTASAVSFETLFSMPGGEPRATEMQLGVARCGAKNCLTLRLASGATGGKLVSTPLVRGVASAHIAYLGGGADAKWRSDWPAGLGAPKLVRIALDFPRGDSRRWPTLFVALPGGTVAQ